MDGDSVAYVGDGQSSTSQAPNRDIWLTLIGGSDSRQLTSSPEDDWSPMWSPDGREIAFVRTPAGAVFGGGEVWLVSPLGGTPRRLNARTPVLSQLSWAPDSQSLAAPGYRVPNDTTSKAGGLQLISTSDGSVRSLTTPRDAGYDAYPAFSSDGRRLAYSSCDKEVAPPCDVFVVSLDASLHVRSGPIRLTTMHRPIHGIT